MIDSQETIDCYRFIHRLKGTRDSSLITNILMKTSEFKFTFHVMPITCTLSGKFLIVPVRNKDCGDLNCVFNLDEGFAKYFLSNPGVKCPSCSTKLFADKFVVCNQTELILGHVFSQKTEPISSTICIDAQEFAKKGHQSPDKYVLFKNQEEIQTDSPTNSPLSTRLSSIPEPEISEFPTQNFHQQIESISKSTAVPNFSIVKQTSYPMTASIDLIRSSSDIHQAKPNKWLTREYKSPEIGKSKWEDRKRSNSPENPQPQLRQSISMTDPKKSKEINLVKMVKSLSTCRASYLRVKARDYFNSYARWKILHYFQENTKNLFILDIENIFKLESPNTPLEFEKVELNSKNVIPHSHYSIVDPYGEIYLIGGFDPKTSTQTDEILVYHEKSRLMILKGKLNIPRSGHTCCIVREYIYIIGGYTDEVLTASCERFNYVTGMTESIADLKTPSAFACIINYGNRFLFKFGGKIALNKMDENVERYNIASGVWETLYISPNTRKIYKPCCLAAGVQINENELYLFGGSIDHYGEKSNLSFRISIMEDEKDVAKITGFEKISMPIADRYENNSQVVIFDNHIFCLQDAQKLRDNREPTYSKRVLIYDGDSWILSS